MSDNKTFVELLQEDLVNPDQLDKFVQKWHTNYNGDKQLYEFLGMIWEEYLKITNNPDEIKNLFSKKKISESK